MFTGQCRNISNKTQGHMTPPKHSYGTTARPENTVTLEAQEKKNFIIVSFMNIKANKLNKMLLNQILEQIKNTHHNQIGFISSMHG